MRDWTKENKRNPPVQFRVTRAEFAELRSAGWKRRPRVSAHGEAKLRIAMWPDWEFKPPPKCNQGVVGCKHPEHQP